MKRKKDLVNFFKKREFTNVIDCFNKNKELFYRGQYDDSRPSNNIQITGSDISNAVNLLLKDKDAPKIQTPSIGCNIKWK